MPATSPMKKPMADDTAPANAMVIMTASRPAEGCAPNQMIGTIHRPATRAAANHGPQLRASRLTMTDVVLVSESGMTALSEFDGRGCDADWLRWRWRRVDCCTAWRCEWLFDWRRLRGALTSSGHCSSQC